MSRSIQPVIPRGEVNFHPHSFGDPVEFTAQEPLDDLRGALRQRFRGVDVAGAASVLVCEK
jgi:hypothetical protein